MVSYKGSVESQVHCAVYELRIFVRWPGRVTMAESQVALSQVRIANIRIFTQILKKVLNFLEAKSGYQQPKFQVVYELPGYC